MKRYLIFAWCCHEGGGLNDLYMDTDDLADVAANPPPFIDENGVQDADIVQILDTQTGEKMEATLAGGDPRCCAILAGVIRWSRSAYNIDRLPNEDWSSTRKRATAQILAEYERTRTP